MGGKFIIVDGIDGSGKGTFMDTIKEEHGPVFDLAKYTKEHHKFPDLNEIEEKIIFSIEPTHMYVGSAIRKEILKGDHKYSGITTAHAFALDRQILYNSFILPALKAGKTIIQERGVASSLVYQPIQLEKLTLRDIANLEGNKIAIKNSPNFLIIIKADPGVIAGRVRKKQKGIFDNLFFQRKVEERFESDWLKKVFERYNTKVLYLDSNCTLTEMREKSLKLFKDYILNGQKTL